MRSLALVLLVLTAAVQYRLWVGPRSLADLRHLEHAVEERRAENHVLESLNQRLEAEVRDLKVGTAAVEEQARRDLGMIGEDEVFYQVVAQ